MTQSEGNVLLTSQDVMRVTLNVDSQAVHVYVAFDRLQYLSEQEVADYQSKEHPQATAYNGSRLDPANVDIQKP